MNAKISLKNYCPIFSLLLLLYVCTASQAETAYHCLRAPDTLLIDGLLIDWNKPVVNITSWNWRHTADKVAVYGGDVDCSATLQLAWDKEQLYLSLCITDDYHVGRNNPQDGDSLILTIAPAIGDIKTYSSIDIAICEANGLALAYRRNESGDWQEEYSAKIGMTISNQFTPPAPYPCEKEKQVATVIRDSNYEITLPWKLFPFINPTDGNEFGILLQIQDVDEKVIRGFLRWRGLRDAPLTASGYGKVVLKDTK